MAITARQKEILNQLVDYLPALRKGQIGPQEGGDILLGDIIEDAAAIVASDIASNAVTTAKIADDAVTTAKIDDGAVTEAKLLPSSTDGLNAMRVAKATYDFAVDGGAISSIGLGVTLPDNAIILRGWADIITPFVSTGGAGTVALSSEASGDLLAPVDADTLSGIEDLIPNGAAANAIKLTAAQELTLEIAGEAMTAGKAVFYVQYVVSE